MPNFFAAVREDGMPSDALFALGANRRARRRAAAFLHGRVRAPAVLFAPETMMAAAYFLAFRLCFPRRFDEKMDDGAATDVLFFLRFSGEKLLCFAVS